MAVAQILTEPLGNLATFARGTRALECVEIGSDDLARRIVRVETSLGSIGLRLEGERRLRDGDVVAANAHVVVALRVFADDVLVYRPRSLDEALAIAHALGNRHLPVQISEATLVVRFDPLVEALFLEHGVAYTRERRVLEHPFRHAHAPHDG